MLCDVMSSHLVQYYSVLRSTVLQSTTRYYSNLLPRSTRYDSSTTKNYSGTAAYSEVLLRTTPHTTPYYTDIKRSDSPKSTRDPTYLTKYYYRTTKYHSSTTNYYEVLLQYYKVLLRITKDYSGTTPYYKVLNLQQLLRPARKVTLDLHQVLRLPRKVTLDLHQLLRLPHRMTRRLDPRHICNVISNARSNKCHPPNSPHTAPATQNDHPTSGRNLRKTAETSFPMRGRSDQDPITFRDRFRQSATRHATEVTFRAPDERFVLKNTTFRAPAIFPNFTKYCAYHEKWHFNFTKYCAYHAKWHLTFTKYCACHEKWHLNFTKYCAYHAKWHLTFTKYCAYHEKWHLTFTNYCACHTEWLACLILVTYETSFPMRGATNVTLQTHQIHQIGPYCACNVTQTVTVPIRFRPFRPFPSNPPRNRGYLRSGRAFCIEKYNISRSG